MRPAAPRSRTRIMNPLTPPTRFAALPLALAAAALSGCPDTTENAPGGCSLGMVRLLQTVGGDQDPQVSSLSEWVVSPDDTKIYAGSWDGNLVTFDRSSVDGSLAYAYASPLHNVSGVTITPD